MSDIFNEQKGWIQKSIKSKGTFQVGFMDIIPAMALKLFTSKTNFSNYLLIFDAYSNYLKLYGMDKIATE